MFSNRHESPTEPEEILACRACLDTNTHLYKMDNILASSLTRITGEIVSQYDQYPQFICEKCKYLTIKFLAFQNRCTKASEMLKRYYLWNKLNMVYIKNMDRTGLDATNLQSTNVLTLSFNPKKELIITHNPVLHTVNTSPAKRLIPVSIAPKTTYNNNNVNFIYKKDNVIHTVNTSPAIIKPISIAPKTTEHINKANNLKGQVTSNENHQSVIYQSDFPCYQVPSLLNPNANFQPVSVNSNVENLITYNDLVTDLPENSAENSQIAFYKRYVQSIPSSGKESASEINIYSKHSEPLNESDIKDEPIVEEENSSYHERQSTDESEGVMQDMNEVNSLQEELVDTKDDLIIKEEHLIHPVEDDDDDDDDDDKEISTIEQSAKTIVDKQITEENDKKDESLNTKDYLIVVEEHLIHPIDDDKIQKTKHTENIEKNRNTKMQPEVFILDCDSSSSSSSSSSRSSSTSSSDSSSSSDTDDAIEIHEIQPTEIDLTADDDDSIKIFAAEDTTDANKSNTNNNETSVPLIESVAESEIADINRIDNIPNQSTILQTNKDDTTEMEANFAQFNKLNANASNQDTLPQTYKDNTTEMEVNVPQFTKLIATIVSHNVTTHVAEDSDQQNLQTKETDNQANSAIINGKDEAAIKRNKEYSRYESSESEEDLPDCLIGLNSDIYKKDVKRAFSKSETEINKPKSKPHFVDEIYVNVRELKRRTVDDICADVTPETPKKPKIGNISKVAQEFLAKRRKRLLRTNQNYERSRIIRKKKVPIGAKQSD